MTRRTTRTSASRTTTLLAAAAIAVVPLAGCDSESPGEPLPTAEESVEVSPDDEGSPGVGDDGEGGAAAESLVGKVDQDVSFTGEVDTVINADAFTVGGDEVGEDPILVVGADLPPSFSEGDIAMISGTVKYFIVQDFNEGLDLDLSDDEFTDFDGDPAVQASSVTIETQS